MTPAHSYRFVEELRQQCRFALVAFQQLRSAVNEFDQERVFVHAHSMVSHAAAVACLFWPARETSIARGEWLRREFPVAGTSPLQVVALRTSTKRPDESFEDWLGTLEKPDYVDMSVMAVGTLSGFKEDVFQRQLDPDALRFGFRNGVVDLHGLGQELRRLEGACQAWMKTHTPW